MTRQNWLLLAVAGILAASVVVTGLLVVRLLGSPPSDEPVEVLPDPVVALAEGSSIIYVLAGGEEAAVYLLDPQEGRQSLVSADDGGFYAYPSWSPHGDYVAYWGASEMPFVDEEVAQGVWVSPIDGSGPILVSHSITRVLDDPPVWSPEGAQVAFLSYSPTIEGRGVDGVITIVSADGSRIIRSLTLPQYFAHRLYWSPTGEELLISAYAPRMESGIYRMSVDGQGLRPLYSGAWAADWSPDGQEIAVGDLLAGTIVILGPGEEQRELARFQGQRSQDVVWSPDGSRIAVATTPFDNRDIATGLHIVTVGTGFVVTVVEDQGWLMQPSWSPDGRLLLFTMGESMEPPEGVNIPDANMWIYDVDRNELERLTNETGFAGLGAWSPVGH